MNILVTNDDGIYSPGIKVLTNEFKKLGKVTVVAPDAERSAVGHSITINHPLRVKEVRKDGAVFGYAINGTPADCVKIALGTIMTERADMVISGINQGLNIGTNVIYSGTVSGAMEGAILGLPSLAISIDIDKYNENNDNYEESFLFPARFSVFLAKSVIKYGLPERTLLNINFPFCAKKDIKGVAITRQAETVFRDRFQRRLDPREKVYYWLEGENEEIDLEGGDNLDFVAVRKGLISITPLSSDLTNHGCIERLKCWNLSLGVQRSKGLLDDF